MKHIFKKLHHHPNRSNETPQQPPPPQSPPFSDNRAASSSPVAASSTAATSTPAVSAALSSGGAASEGNNSLQHHTQQDYYASEEEYQVQLALALSVSSSGQDSALIDPEKAPIRITDNGEAAADLLSRRYWNFGVLDFEERVVDGFYDVYNLSSDPASRGNMPSLTDLESDTGASDYEVVIVNRKIDPALEELMQIAHCIELDCPTSEINLLIQRLAELVTEHLGGPVRDANVILAKWIERSMKLRTSLHTSVLPIGSLRIGLSRHRALLFKALADSVGIPCRLVKGSHYTGVEDDAVNIIKLHDDSECLVDLMGAPGTLIPADALSGRDTPLKPYSTQSSRLPSADPRVSSTQPGYLGGYNFPLGATSWKPEALLTDASANDGVGTSGLHDNVPSANQSGHGVSQGIGSSLYKGGRGPNLVSDGARINVNVVPYSPKTAEDPKNLFADLNPFQIKGSGKTVVQNDISNEAGKMQFSKNNLISGRPPSPLMWKNRHAWNDVPKENESGFLEGSSGKNNAGTKKGNAPSVLSTSSKPPAKASKFPEKSLINSADRRDDTYNNNFMSASGESGHGQLPPGKDSSLNNSETYLREDVKNEEAKVGDSENVITRLHGEKKILPDRLSMANMKMKGNEGSSNSLNLGTNHADTEIDDVVDCEIVWEDLVLGERIGLGSYGEVYHADWNGTEVAVKKFLDQDFSGAALDEFKREVRIMRRLRHPNVVLFMGAVTRPPNLSIITEFLPRGSLYRIIHRPHCQIDEKRRIKMALDVAKGMNCLHTSIPTIVHRDLKSPNLLVDNNWNVKVGDFGLSRLKHNTFLSSKSTAGTPEWMAPEVLRNEPSNEKCDVYSFGIILWELATLKLPWSGMNPMQVVGAVGFQNRRLDIPKDVDPLVGRIIWECWQTDPNLRPSFAQLCVALKPLQRLVVSSHVEQPQVNSTP
ncbi:serine/threonine-protein kinase EDR1-like [Salvia splendens]|uniref:serine/threonine-protein kinase EDR1-like n=1 Tax=Salvia splendens TaxID=180675 RepID=UPI001C25CEF9|nr:serine/threonine-protein kinase EDR1-like [Salvia splendens]